MTLLRRAAIASIFIGLGAVACHESYPPCYVGEYVLCGCEGGGHGYAACLSDETGYDACVCDGTTPGLDAGSNP